MINCIKGIWDIYKWVRVFKNGPSKICGRQPKQTFFFKFFKGYLPQVLLGPFLNTFSQI